MGLRHFKIGSRLAWGFGTVLCMLLVVTLLGMSRVDSINTSLAGIGEVHSVKQRYAINFRGSVHDRAIALRDVVLEKDAAGVQRQLQQIDKLAADYTASAKPLQAIIARTDVTNDQERQALQAIEHIEAKTLPLSAQVIRLRQEQRIDEAQTLLLEQVRPLYTQWLAAINVLIDMQEVKTQGGSASAITVAADFRALMVWCCGLAIVLGALIAWRTTRSIVQPLEQAVRLTERIAAGDLSHRIARTGRDELTLLGDALTQMCSSLEHMVHKVREGSDAVSTASMEIAQGNHELSTRTEHQASALQQAASSMEQLSATVRQNADFAQQANTLAQQASVVAEQGGHVTAQVMDTMKGIHDSSREIADIIGVIDSIAFQTNILALNAAVEAARAGEQGRGFAVVATEVRTLAQRSADAAKQIKHLITDSVDRVAQGSALVDQAASTMEKLVSSIHNVTGIMGEISAASAEQSQGVLQVGNAVNHIDQATQQNATLVEEMAAAANSLRNQAQDLVVAVAAFQLQSLTSLQPAGHRPTALPAARSSQPLALLSR